MKGNDFVTFIDAASCLILWFAFRMKNYIKTSPLPGFNDGAKSTVVRIRPTLKRHFLPNQRHMG